MVLLGTIVNTVTIILGSLIGTVLNKIPDKIKTTVSHGMALAVVVLGIQMGFKSHQYLIVIGSLAIGAIIGEWIDLEDKLNRVGQWLEKGVQSKNSGSVGNGNVAKAFVTATLVFVIGAMSIVGAINSGLLHDHRVLYTKAVLDGFFSIIFATTLGFGVIFSSIPVFLYEGIIALCATFITKFIPDPLLNEFINEMSATGGILILAIGLNLLNITKVKTANLLPSILICALLVTLHYLYNN